MWGSYAMPQGLYVCILSRLPEWFAINFGSGFRLMRPCIENGQVTRYYHQAIFNSRVVFS